MIISIPNPYETHKYTTMNSSISANARLLLTTRTLLNKAKNLIVAEKRL